ncbi:BAT38-like protein [Mya arenaria]|uniref:BAT38-like protein n=1 Tax=Mya arenaria TaxID=6604 RepID=A0ABY7F6Z4_MYAAR|nr:uncharacterized protein LOC128206545 [Mya arenaria]XP_052765056.1 uncharacterized protein LOC128206545 [Mya arenaria]XP_052765057.1 uncharacterized protein LOC128206545 [Mya arenaria]XP_052765058.1 uncharacterized protein LOC128206545 [Mya arenaria]XP_052765059.1 uncharacterized protein LOC128206545 [Mya arenaria]XP_052765061.1 uncharacterized protein LOC128206545 [Mya arenaria]WAR17960.1 BAT38-like protein [Mya arenaria]
MSAQRDFTVNDALSDVTVVVEGTKLYVHRQYLAEWSGVWRKLFVAECPDDVTSSIEIIIEDKKLDEVLELLHCIYSSQKPTSDSNVDILLDFAEEYDMPSMRNRCEDYLCAQDASIEHLIVAEKFDLKHLYKQCVDFAKTRTLEDLEKDPLCKCVSEKTLTRIYKEKVNMMRDYANDLKQSETKLTRANEQLLDEKEGMAAMLGSIGKIWEMPNKRCYKHMTDDRFDFTCRDCNEKIQREVRRMCSDAQHVRRFFTLNNK